MYRNAAREFEKGYSAGMEIWRWVIASNTLKSLEQLVVRGQLHSLYPSQAACCSYFDLPPVLKIFRDLERDESTWASLRGRREALSSRSVRRNARFRGHGSLGSVTSSMADWSSNSSFLELREFGPKTSSDNPASRPQSKGMASSGPEDNGGEHGGGDQDNYEWESEDGEGLLDNTGAAGNDWLVPARRDRDDKLDHSKSASLDRAPRWEDTYAFRRSKSRRGVIHSAPSPDDVSEKISISSDAASWLFLIKTSRRCISWTALVKEGCVSIVSEIRDSVVCSTGKLSRTSFASGSAFPKTY